MKYTSHNRPFVVSCLVGGGAGFLCGVLLLLLLCAVGLTLDDPNTRIRLFAYLALVPAAWICGMISAKATGQNGIVSGLCGGGIFSAILLAVSFCIPYQTELTEAAFPVLLCVPVGILLFSVLGGYTARHKKPKSHRPRIR